MKVRIVLSAVVVALFALIQGIYSNMRGPVEAAAAVAQLEDSIISYSASVWFMSGGFMSVMGMLLFLVLCGLWYKPVVNLIKRSKGMKANLVLLVALVAMSGCMGPPEVLPVDEIGPNETAFLIPMEGASKDGQGKFMSEEFLLENKVAGKRVTIPVRERKIGRGYWSYEWIPTLKVMKVDRTPITREWTDSEDTGTDKGKQGIKVESKESIGFSAGVTITVSITEDDAHTYLYWYNVKLLAEVVDQNIRGYIQTYLANEFGKLTIDECRIKKTLVMEAMAKAVTTEFKTRGISVLNVGASEGLTYESGDVQESIDAAYSAQRKLDRAKVDAKTAKEKAKGEAEASIAKAEGEAKAMLALAEAEAKANRLVNESLTPNILALRALNKWAGLVPSTLMLGQAAPLPTFDIGMNATSPIVVPVVETPVVAIPPVAEATDTTVQP
jgi:hypothetical protein